MSTKPQVSQYLTPQDKLAIFRQIESNMAAGFILAMDIFDEQLGGIIEKKTAELKDLLASMDLEIKHRELKDGRGGSDGLDGLDGEQGEPGPMGPPGHTPTTEELTALIKNLLPTFDPREIATLAAEVVTLPTKELEQLTNNFHLLENKLIDLEKALNQKPSGKGRAHGGGDTVLAGTGVTITKNTDGSKTVSVSAASDVTSGVGAPVSTPATLGARYIDTTNKNIYIAVGTSSSADWVIVASFL